MTHTYGRTGLAVYNPWGEPMHIPAGVEPPYRSSGELPADNGTSPPAEVFEAVPLGLGGHFYDIGTGLVYMHNRYYHPRLGHFLTPDFRAPDIYDPSTFTEPYAYAAGNPVMFWDPDGRRVAYLGQDSDGFGWMGILYTLNGSPQIALISRLEWEMGMKGQGQPIGNMKFVGPDTDAFWERSEFLQYQLLEQIHGYGSDIEILPDPMKHFQRDAMLFTGAATVAPFAIGAMIVGLPAEATIGIGAAHLGSFSIAAGTTLPVAFFTDLGKGARYTPKVIDALKMAAGIQIGHATGYAIGAGISGHGANAWRNIRFNEARLQRFSNGGANSPKINLVSKGPDFSNQSSGTYKVWGREFKWKKANLGPDTAGETDPFGNVQIDFSVKGDMFVETLRHEGVHAFFSSTNPTRVRIGMFGYNNSNVLRYLEEALAEGFATKSVIRGAKFPIKYGYVTPHGLVFESSIWGGGAYFTYDFLDSSISGED